MNLQYSLRLHQIMGKVCLIHLQLLNLLLARCRSLPWWREKIILRQFLLGWDPDSGCSFEGANAHSCKGQVWIQFSHLSFTGIYNYTQPPHFKDTRIGTVAQLHRATPNDHQSVWWLVLLVSVHPKLWPHHWEILGLLSYRREDNLSQGGLNS